MSELTASIAHEINQPLSAIITNSQAGLRWLARAEPDLDEVRKALNRIADDGRRAGEVLSSIRAMFGEGRREKQSVKVNDLICDVLTLIHAELERQHVALQMELSDGVFEIIADRVQLQQVLLNLFNNALEAMSSVTGRPRLLSVKSQTLEPSDIAILVEDCGAGIDPNIKRMRWYAYQVVRIWKKWLSRRDRRRRLHWNRLNDLLTRHPLPAARIVHRYTAASEALP
jgi:C4-dicarboxylate-specific signal transduction histidine kinase